MNVRSLTRYHLLGAMLAVPLVACGGGQNAQSTDLPSASPTTELPGSPGVEPTGPESPGPAGRGGVAISLPSLPVGGGADDSDSVHQCVTVSWKGQQDIPDGVSVVVTAVQITPAGVFERGGGGCGGAANCGASFAFTSGRTACSVPVTARGTDGKSANLSLRGSARCPAGEERKCQDLAAHVTGQPIPLQQPRQRPSSSEVSSPSSTG
jgi:hypothetical protein